MKLRTRQGEEPNVSLTPLIDVMFLLVIFFMVSTTFQRQSDLEIVLPESQAEPTEEQRQTLELAIDAKGRYFINEKQVINTELDTLMRAIKKARAGKADLPLVIRADARTPHQAVVRAMDAAGQLGITQISIATVHDEDAS